MHIDCIDVRLPADEHHVMPSPRQQTAIVASHRSSSDVAEPQQAHLEEP